jgi:hypothetical protein
VVAGADPDEAVPAGPIESVMAATARPVGLDQRRLAATAAAVLTPAPLRLSALDLPDMAVLERVVRTGETTGRLACPNKAFLPGEIDHGVYMVRGSGSESGHSGPVTS